MARHPVVPMLFVSLACACQSGPAHDPAAVQATIDRILAHHATVIAQEDLDAVMRVYTEDPIVRSNHMEPLRGRDALRATIGGLFGSLDISDLEYHTEELAVFGDSALQIGSYRWVLHTGEQAVPDGGEFFALWIRGDDDSWRVHRNIFNSTSPLPGQSE